MTNDTADFLAALLFTADNQDDDARPFMDRSVNDFHPDFSSAVESFINGFRDYIDKKGFDLSHLDGLGRSFGGSTYLSLSGHGAGFFDESPASLGHSLQSYIEMYSASIPVRTGGARYRFEGLDCNLSIDDAGKIDLAILPSHITEYRNLVFGIV